MKGNSKELEEKVRKGKEGRGNGKKTNLGRVFGDKVERTSTKVEVHDNFICFFGKIDLQRGTKEVV